MCRVVQGDHVCAQMVRRAHAGSRLQTRHGARLAGQLDDVHAGIGAIDNIDVAAVVDFGIVGLNRDLAAVHAIDLETTLVGVLRDCGNIVGGLARLYGSRRSTTRTPALNQAMNTRRL